VVAQFRRMVVRWHQRGRRSTSRVRVRATWNRQPHWVFGHVRASPSGEPGGNCCLIHIAGGRMATLDGTPLIALSSVATCCSRLWKWLEQITPSCSSLSWCHSTDAFALRNILESGMFVPRLCPVFKKDLLYFFYGRPAYRKSTGESIGIPARAPVVFVLAPDLVDMGVRVFPFDTGAYAAGRYGRWIHESMVMEDFEMPCRDEAPLSLHSLVAMGGI
jgi:hypothetical protein